jgi:TolA-binding protein
MRSLLAAALVFSLVLPFAAPAEAQSTRLPRKSRSERIVEDINRNLQREDRQRRFEQQYQIDNNQIRQSIDRQRTFSYPPAAIPSVRRGTCPPGSVGC